MPRPDRPRDVRHPGHRRRDPVVGDPGHRPDKADGTTSHLRHRGADRYPRGGRLLPQRRHPPHRAASRPPELSDASDDPPPRTIHAPPPASGAAAMRWWPRSPRAAWPACTAAWDAELEVWRAVKVLLPEYANARGRPERFEREASAMARLEHPNVIRVYDVVTDEALPYIVMEILRGRQPDPLARRLRRHAARPGVPGHPPRSPGASAPPMPRASCTAT